MYLRDTSPKETARKVVGDALKALSGLAVSVALAFGLPWLHELAFER